MSKIRPIKILRDTNKISEVCHLDDEPIFITKNGYEDLVIQSFRGYQNILKRQERDNPTGYQRLNLRPFDYSKLDKNFGIVRVGAYTPKVKVGNIDYNVEEIKKGVLEAVENKVSVLVFPELCITSYTVGDMIFNQTVLHNSLLALENLKEFSKDLEIVFFVGFPLELNNKIYNCAAAISKGEILGIVSKTHVPTYKEFYEGRYFSSYRGENVEISINNVKVPFGTKLIFKDERFPDLTIGTEICEDLWAPDSPSTNHCLAGANLIVNLSASNEIVAKADYRRDLVKFTSGKLICGYVYSSAGPDESTGDLLYSGHRIICKNSYLISEGELFSEGLTFADLDIESLTIERRKVSTYSNMADGYAFIPFNVKCDPVKLINPPMQNPFLLPNQENRYRQIVKMQALGLKKRLEAINSTKVILGLSGGLDSTLALIVCKVCFEIMGIDSKNIFAITMPCFGTSSRTYQNAIKLSNMLGVTLQEVNIRDSVLQHFKDIGQDPHKTDVTFENSQARERTQVLMDLGNKLGALLVGTGDLSELAIGWCTYNGDHMSMYGLNSSIPKTLVKELVRVYAIDHEEVKEILLDIISTPISPELLPLKDGAIEQKSEESVGPYELVDYFLFYFVRHSFTLDKILYFAEQSYEGVYSKEELKHWLKLFTTRFLRSQFKRNALPDGVKVGTVGLSPRGDYRMPSDSNMEAEILSSLNKK